MSANTVNAGVSILGCRNGLPVSKIIWKRGSGCEVIEYSDGLTDTDWIEGECAKIVYDSETTCVEENDNIYILRFSEVDGTYRVYDFSGTDVTGTVTPIKCAGAEQFDIRSAGFYCIDGITTLERFDIVDITTSTISSSIWQDLTGVVVSTPTGVITAGACSTVLLPTVLADINCATANPNVKECNSDAILADIDASNLKLEDIKALLVLGNASLASILAEGDTHLISEVSDICVDNLGVKTSYRVATYQLWNAETGATVGPTFNTYSSDGVTWSLTAPTGTISLGYCTVDAPVGYNNVSHITATVGSPVTIPANSVHSITYQVIGSPADITIGSTTITYPSTSVGNDEATDLIVQSYTFAPTGTGTVIIRTIN